MMATIPMSRPDITSAERAAVFDVLSGATLALGPRLDGSSARSRRTSGRASRWRRRAAPRRCTWRSSPPA